STNAAGKYCWRADYSGDATYLASSHTDGTAECFTVVLPPQPTTTVTNSNPIGGNVAPGTSASDTATVSGSSGTPTGTVTFFLCDPATVAANGGDCSTGGSVVGAWKTLTDGAATSDASTSTGAAGKYCWRAEYSGDATYL